MPSMVRVSFPVILMLLVGVISFPQPLSAQHIDFPIGRADDGSPLTASIPSNLAESRLRVLVINAGNEIETVQKTVDRNIALCTIEFPLEKHHFPPKGTAYNAGDIAGLYLWRWIGTEAFDRVIIVAEGTTELKHALEGQDIAKLGTVPCTVVSTPAEIEEFLHADNLVARHPQSAASERRKRADRSPLEVATALSAHYGRQLQSIAYIPSLAVIGRQRLGELTGNTEWNTEASALIAPWLERDHPPSPGKIPGASTVAGYLVFADAFDRTNDIRARNIVETIASIGLNDKNGEPVDVIPNHNEMSDSVFMNPPLLAAAGRLTGDERYFHACQNHIRAIQKLCLRSDGIYRHSPLDEAAWGRGNGFPALGLALVLTDLPAHWEGRPELVKDFQDHLAALLPYQDATGMWHQVIDHPESYREFTSTCMITFAMLRGMRLGLLDDRVYSEPAAKGWAAIRQRIGTNGLDLTDVCTGTGKQKDLEAYFHRTAILGKDDRGGAMALMLATEAAFREQETGN